MGSGPQRLPALHGRQQLLVDLGTAGGHLHGAGVVNGVEAAVGQQRAGFLLFGLQPGDQVWQGLQLALLLVAELACLGCRCYGRSRFDRLD